MGSIGRLILHKKKLIIKKLEENKILLNRIVTSEPFIFKITTNSPSQNFTLPLIIDSGYIYDFIVEWGDGSSHHITSYDQAEKIHTYIDPGEYTIIINGICEGFRVNDDSSIKSFITNIISWGDTCNFKSLNFRGCNNLSSFPDIPFTSVEDLIDCSYLFYNCTSLHQSIPISFFDNAIKITNVSNAFYGCSGLTGSIPTDLFRYNTLISTNGFNSTFYGCSSLTGSIPTDLFRYNTLVSINGFNYTFYGCSSLTGSIPVDLFKYNTLVSSRGFYGTFLNCSSLTGSIPTDLFRYNTLVSTYGFQFTFRNCSGLTGSIPTDLFRYNTLVSINGFYETFYYCSELTEAPNELFKYNTLVQGNGFYRTFYNCINLKINPYIFYDAGDENYRFLNISLSFYRCFHRGSFTGTQGAAPDLWNCDFGTGIVTKTECYGGSGNSLISLSNYADIPTDWIT